MSEKRIIGLLVVITLVSLAFAGYEVASQRGKVVVPINGGEALEIIKTEPSASAFITENLGSPEDRIERVALAWDQETDTYRWEIEIQERSCGCRLNETEGVTILRAGVDPYNGAIYNLSTRVGVPEDQIKREACEKGCHSE